MVGNMPNPFPGLKEQKCSWRVDDLLDLLPD